MKFASLYIRILISFLIVLFITEFLIFGIFIITVGQFFHERINRYYCAKVDVAKAFIEEKIRTTSAADLSSNQELKRLIRFIAEKHQAKLWLTDSSDALILTSFKDDDLPDISHHEKENFQWRRKHHLQCLYSSVALNIESGSKIVLHVMFERIDPHEPRYAFLFGLACIGLVIALLIVPVSRRITRPLKNLHQSVVKISEGDLSHRAEINSRDEIGRLAEAFNIMADRLERMIRGGRELTANISHELRSPLARMRVALELAHDLPQTDKNAHLKRHMGIIEDEIENLDHLIDRILTLSRFEIHETPMKIEAIDPVSLTQSILEKLKPAADCKKLNIHTRFSFSGTFHADQNALQTAFLNILDNAVKYTPESGTINVDIRRTEDHLHFNVVNHHPPLTDNDLDHLFTPFYRAEKARSRGYGLGLAITAKIVQRHSGKISATNVPEGVSIEILLPIRRQG